MLVRYHGDVKQTAYRLKMDVHCFYILMQRLGVPPAFHKNLRRQWKNRWRLPPREPEE